jgi:hypothetical protein
VDVLHPLQGKAWQGGEEGQGRRGKMGA